MTIWQLQDAGFSCFRARSVAVRPLIGLYGCACH